MKNYKVLLITGVTCIFIGLAGLIPAVYFNLRNSAAANTPTYITQAPTPAPSQTVVVGKPLSLSIPSLKKELAIADGVYNEKTGAWTLSLDKAHFALLSSKPNNVSGNTIIYGHYRPEVFASLRKIKQGETASIKTDNGYLFNYRFQSTKAVNPKDTSVFDYQGQPILTIQTCSGAWMQNRQLYTFSLVGYEKIPV